MFEPRRNGLSIVFVALIYDAVSLTNYLLHRVQRKVGFGQWKYGIPHTFV